MLRGVIFLLSVAFCVVSCNSTRRLSNTGSASTSSGDTNNAPLHSSTLSSKRVYKDGQHSSSKDLGTIVKRYSNLNVEGKIEKSNELQFKYAVLTDVPVEELDNMNLLYYMEEWYGTPYRYGGTTKKGIDCSAFTLGLMSSVFSITIPRTAREQYAASRRIKTKELREGDLVFFHTRKGISHVGVYLFNNKFVHASLSNGVMISDLGDSYFVKRYRGAGRFTPSM